MAETLKGWLGFKCGPTHGRGEWRGGRVALTGRWKCCGIAVLLLILHRTCSWQRRRAWQGRGGVARARGGKSDGIGEAGKEGGLWADGRCGGFLRAKKETLTSPPRHARLHPRTQPTQTRPVHPNSTQIQPTPRAHLRSPHVFLIYSSTVHPIPPTPCHLR